jgi:hypothetical protein
MTNKRPAKKVPAKKAGADRLAEKRALAAERREERDKFEAQHGEGHIALENFLDAFKQYDDFKDPADRENFHYYTREIAFAIRAYLTHEAGTLVKAFKVRRPVGYRQPAARKKFMKMATVQRDGLTLRKHGAVVDDAFFELLAELHGIKTTAAREYYYAKHKGAKPEPGKSADQINPAYRARLNWKK